MGRVYGGQGEGVMGGWGTWEDVSQPGCLPAWMSVSQSGCLLGMLGMLMAAAWHAHD